MITNQDIINLEDFLKSHEDKEDAIHSYLLWQKYCEQNHMAIVHDKDDCKMILEYLENRKRCNPEDLYNIRRLS